MKPTNDVESNFDYCSYKAQEKNFARIIETVNVESGYFSGYRVFTIVIDNIKLGKDILPDVLNQGTTTIMRRYSDFEKFHTSIRETYPEILLPSLPPKTSIAILHKSEASDLKNRIEGLEMYLNKILTNKILSKTEEFQHFFANVI